MKLPAGMSTIRALMLAMANMADIDMIKKNNKVKNDTTNQGTMRKLLLTATPDIIRIEAKVNITK